MFPQRSENESPAASRLFQLLQRLHLEAGAPSRRDISKRLGQGVLSHTTVNGVLRRPAEVKWGQLELVADALGGEIAELRQLWTAAQEERASGIVASGRAHASSESPMVGLFIGDLSDWVDKAEHAFSAGDYIFAQRSAAVVAAAALAAEGEAARRLGHLERADAALREALDLQKANVGPNDPMTLLTRQRLARVMFQQGHLDNALGEITAVVEAWERLGARDDHRGLRARLELGFIQSMTGHAAEAEPDLRAALEVTERLFAADGEQVALARTNYGICLARQGRLDEAEVQFRWVKTTRSRTFGHEHPKTLYDRNGGVCGLHSDELPLADQRRMDHRPGDRRLRRRFPTRHPLPEQLVLPNDIIPADTHSGPTQPLAAVDLRLPHPVTQCLPY